MDYIDDVAAVARIDSVPTMLETVARLTGMRFAAVARVTDDRWIACSVRDELNFGLAPGGELDLRTTICHEIRQSGEAVVIEDVATDPDYVDHHTPALYGFRSYISMPIRLGDGQFFGTLCALDPEPRQIGKNEVDLFRLFADLIGMQLNQADQLAASEATISRHQADSELREQFIAVVGHDLRNPLASVQAGITLLDMGQPPERTKMIIAGMQTSIERMSQMIDNILDFARGRLGGGLTLEMRTIEISPLIEQVVGEIGNSHPERDLRYSCEADTRLHCDPARFAQLLSNLLGNAVTHGAPDQPIEVHCEADDRRFLLSVTNGGDAIPPAAMERLFHPFARGKVTKDKEGLGLGLYIASQIAKAHQGTLSAHSDASHTRFTLEIPVAGAGKRP